MNARKRFRQTLLFKNPDRIPFQPGEPRESTLRAWYTQGVPPGCDYFDGLIEALDLTPDARPRYADIGVSFRMIPEYEEEILDHRDGHYLIRDWMGAIVEIADSYDPSYLRSPRDFVTRKWHRFPVENRQDWEAMKSRYKANSAGRYPDNLQSRCRELENNDHVVEFRFNGPFWQLREWCGFEGLCLLFHDDPGFVEEMIGFWTDFISETMRPILETLTVDRVGISEDMAYKNHSMISPRMTRDFLAPAYRKWVSEIRQSGCPIIDMDSDGYIGELIPIWIETGMNCCDPIEVAAGNDIVEFRKRFGMDMAYIGGIDKRAIAAGGEVIRAEVMRVVPPLLESGGYIPGCDHGVPPDISWPNYVEYSRLIAELTGWV